MTTPALHAPQERFEAIRRRHDRRSGGRLVDLAYPNPSRVAADVAGVLTRTLAQLDGAGLQYTPYGGAAIPRRHVAHGLRRSHGVRVKVDDVVLTPGAMSALSLTLAAALEGPRREVLVITPCWLDTPLYVAQRGGHPVLVPTRADGHLDMNAIERALTPGTAAVVLSQPANPTGVLYDEEELEALATRLGAMAEPPLWISDECHRDFVFGALHRSPMRRYPRTAVVYSFGKRLLAQGQRLGYVAFHPALEGWSERLRGLARACGHCTPTALMQRALPALMDLDVDLSSIAARRARVVERLRAAGFDPLGEHTMFVYARAPGVDDDFALCEHLASEGVLVMPSSLCHARGAFRLAVTADDDALDEGLSILEQARLQEVR